MEEKVEWCEEGVGGNDEGEITKIRQKFVCKRSIVGTLIAPHIFETMTLL